MGAGQPRAAPATSRGRTLARSTREARASPATASRRRAARARPRVAGGEQRAGLLAGPPRCPPRPCQHGESDRGAPGAARSAAGSRHPSPRTARRDPRGGRPSRSDRRFRTASCRVELRVLREHLAEVHSDQPRVSQPSQRSARVVTPGRPGPLRLHASLGVRRPALENLAAQLEAARLQSVGVLAPSNLPPLHHLPERGNRVLAPGRAENLHVPRAGPERHRGVAMPAARASSPHCRCIPRSPPWASRRSETPAARSPPSRRGSRRREGVRPPDFASAWRTGSNQTLRPGCIPRPGGGRPCGPTRSSTARHRSRPSRAPRGSGAPGTRNSRPGPAAAARMRALAPSIPLSASHASPAAVYRCAKCHRELLRPARWRPPTREAPPPRRRCGPGSAGRPGEALDFATSRGCRSRHRRWPERRGFTSCSQSA